MLKMHDRRVRPRRTKRRRMTQRRRWDPKHPLWRTIHAVSITLVACLGTGSILWMNASNFDSTELNSVIQVGILSLLREGAREIWKI